LKRIERNTVWNKKVKTKNFFSSVTITAALIGAMPAAAQLYKWTDANGKVHYTDSVPPEATNAARKEISSDGIVRKSVDRAMTPEERRVAAIKAEADAKESAARIDRERKDKALLSTYSNVTDFDRVRDRGLAIVDGEITAFGRQLVGLDARRAELAKQVDVATKTKKGSLAKLEGELKTVDAEITAARDFETKRKIDRVELEKNYARERVQFLNLLAAQAAVNPKSEPSATTVIVPAKAK
jgi:hypothetical protein